MRCRNATEDDITAIVGILAANRGDTSLFQQDEHQVRRTLDDFVLAVDESEALAGCAALHWHMKNNAEILAVAVLPELHGKGVGKLLMKECISRATNERDDVTLWLATAKPDYFARYGFRPVSRFRLGPSVLWTKFLLVFQQPAGRWIPALVGRHTFMVHAPQ